VLHPLEIPPKNLIAPDILVRNMIFNRSGNPRRDSISFRDALQEMEYALKYWNKNLL
jgi:hypothetical protein